jgi:hypothetical protein
MKKYGIIKRTSNLTEVNIFDSKADTLHEYNISNEFYPYIDGNFSCKVFVVEDARVIEDCSEYDEEGEYATITIKGRINGIEFTADFHVQLTGGDYLPQMGCWMFTDAGDMEFSDEEWILYKAFAGSIGRLAEKAYQEWFADKLDDGGEWKEVNGWAPAHERHILIGSTASGTWVLEKNADNNAKYRLRIEKSGFIGQNDYAAFPNDLGPIYVDSKEEAREKINE